MAVATWPVRATQPGIGEADIGSQTDDEKSQQRSGKKQAVVECHGASEGDEAVGKQGGEKQGQIED